MREGERARESPRKSRPLHRQAFIAFLGTLHGGWSTFTMHRFTVGDYLLQTTKDRILLITSKRRMLQLEGESGWTGYTPYLKWFNTDFRKLKILSKNLLPQSRVREFSKSNCHSSLGAMQTWFPMGEPVHGLGSCMLNITPTGFSEWELGYISDTWNSSLYNIMLL